MSQLITINLSKGPGTPWGFRLQGGKDFAQPLCIQKVNVGSVAESAGLQAGDAIVSINGADALMLRHKEAQDTIVNNGGSFPMVVQRGAMSWKPKVTALAQPKETPQGPVATKTSLAAGKKANKTTAPKGFNARPAGYGEVNGQPIVNPQYNTPINLYTEDNIAEALSSQSEVLGKGCLGVNFKKNDFSMDKESDVLRMVQEMDRAPKTPPVVTGTCSVYTAASLTPSEMIGTPEIPVQGASFKILERFLSGDDERTGSTLLPSAGGQPANSGYVMRPGENVCSECLRLIVGVFVRIKNKNMHADCFKCNTCGSSLKNVGYYNINDKMYCDAHAKQAAKQNPPAPNMMPVTVKPGAAPPAGALPAAAAAAAMAPTLSKPCPPGGVRLFPVNCFGGPAVPYKRSF